MNRREALRTLLRTGATLAVAPFVGCVTGRRATVGFPRSGDVRVDESFARRVLSEDDGLKLRSELLDHGALRAIVRHQQLAGNGGVTRDEMLASILDSVKSKTSALRVLDAWAKRGPELVEYATAAAYYLPRGAEFAGTVYLAAGYDVGVAAPPDVVLNVAHEHFLNAPTELGFYVTHEAHHVGFFAVRRPPALEGLNEPRRLLSVIRYMTQLEGMGVHAAYALRKLKGALATDPDYEVYVNPAEAHRVTARYGELCANVSRARRLSDEDVGNVLNAMSSGERVWYRFGALACQTLEREHGRSSLVASIDNPTLFEKTVSALLSAEQVPVSL